MHRFARMDLDSSYPTTIATGRFWSLSCCKEGSSAHNMNFKQPQRILCVPLEAEVAPIRGDTNMGNLSVSPDREFLAYPFNSWSASSPAGHVAVPPANGGSPIVTFDLTKAHRMVGPYWTLDAK